MYALIHTHTEKIPVSHNLCVLVMPPLLAVIGLMKQADTAVLRLVIRLTDKVERTAVSLREMDLGGIRILTKIHTNTTTSGRTAVTCRRSDTGKLCDVVRLTDGDGEESAPKVLPLKDNRIGAG